MSHAKAAPIVNTNKAERRAVYPRITHATGEYAMNRHPAASMPPILSFVREGLRARSDGRRRRTLYHCQQEEGKKQPRSTTENVGTNHQK